jgi:hypothetical protein
MVIPGAGRVGRASATLVWVAIALVLAGVIAYGAILGAQGGPPHDSAAVVPFVGGYMLLMALLLALSLVGNPRLAILRAAMLAAAAAGLMLLGFFALMSIGLAIFAAGILAAIAAIRTSEGRSSRNAILSGVAGAVISLTLLLGGFEVTQRIILCPLTGTMGGGSSGFLTGPYHYTCINGKLTMYSGDCNGVTGGFDANGNPISTNGC